MSSKWLAVLFILMLALGIEFFRMYLEKNAILVKDQAFGNVITIDRVTVTHTGKLAVVISSYGQPTDEIIGTSTILRPGIHSSVDIDLKYLDSVSQDKIAPGSEMVVVLYSVAEGNTTDTPQKTLFGDHIAGRFRLL